MIAWITGTFSTRSPSRIFIIRRLLNRQRFYPIFESSRLATDFGAGKRARLARSSRGIARDALAEAMLNWWVPIAARSFFRGTVRISHFTFSSDWIVEEWPFIRFPCQ
ncbi:MAG: hypothetical protein DLM68_09115 [Hyphomicrobiales bacterium]|nr:MAG: hypothetical protein DLM68_09115 [Hyphomicrobiales bacterium]